MTRFEALLSLNMAPAMGSMRLKKLLTFFSRPQDILAAAPEKLMQVSGIGPAIATQIHSLKKEDLDKELALARELNLKLVTIDDDDYPQSLRDIFDPPIVLYIKGELKKEDRMGIGIVGSRRASLYGLNCAERFAAELSGYRFTIVSGMARGIDTSAHRGVLKVGGRTIAVIGSGLNKIYPPENQELSGEIARSGAVISEFPLNTEPLAQNFPRRNRVISGLSLGVLVVEAARNSGALITADFALEQGREVFALPGKVDAQNSFGTNGLIKQGAKLVSCVGDILEEFDLDKSRPNIPEAQKMPKLNLVEEELLLYNLISQEPALLDELAQKANLDIPRISRILFGLQVKKMIKELPGKQFIRMAC